MTPQPLASRAADLPCAEAAIAAIAAYRQAVTAKSAYTTEARHLVERLGDAAAAIRLYAGIAQHPVRTISAEPVNRTTPRTVYAR